MAMKLISPLVLCVVTLQLIGCLGPVPSAAVSGAQVVYNRRNIVKVWNDQSITMQAVRSIDLDSNQFKNAHIIVSTYNGDVLLAGQAPSAWQKAKAAQIVAKIPNVRKVYNLIEISSPSSTLSRISDGWITAKVKAQLIASQDLDASRIKVVTEGGTVYLMGIVPHEEADAAVELARTTAGVQGVVKIFSYLTIMRG